MICKARTLLTLAHQAWNRSFSPLWKKEEKKRREILLSSDVKQKVYRGPSSALDLFCIYLREWLGLIFPENLTAFHNSPGRLILIRK